MSFLFGNGEKERSVKKVLIQFFFLKIVELHVFEKINKLGKYLVVYEWIKIFEEFG